MGDWHEVKRILYRNDPCFGCCTGSCDASQKVENGKYYEKVDYCQETCELYKNYCDDKEHFFGDNIRDAIKVIKG